MSEQTNGVRKQRNIVVIGNGMVGLRFCEKLVEFDGFNRYRITTFCEEPRAAYDRVGLTSFFAHHDAQEADDGSPRVVSPSNGIELHIGDRAYKIDRDAISRSAIRRKGSTIGYNKPLCSRPGRFRLFRPIPGESTRRGVFVYRTIEDHRAHHRLRPAGTPDRAAVIGGGLLGLEAAKAAYDLGTRIRMSWNSLRRLMPRQIDDAGSRILVKQDRRPRRARCILNKATKAGTRQRASSNEWNSMMTSRLMSR